MKRPPRLSTAQSIVFLVTYCVIAEVSMLLATTPENVTPLYPSAGLAWAYAIIYGRRVYPLVFLAAFISNLIPLINGLPTLPVFISALSIGVGEVCSVAFGCWMLTLIRGPERYFKQVLDVMVFSAIALLWVLSPTIGVSALYLNGLVVDARFLNVWLTWWLGDSIGILLLTPLVLAIYSTNWRHLLRADGGKLVVAVVGAAGASVIVFLLSFPLLYLLTAICFMAAYRLSMLGVILTNLSIASVAAAAYLLEVGPAVHLPGQAQLMLLQLFLAFNIVISLVFWCTQNTNRELNLKWSRAETQARLDPLTNIFNRRGFEERALRLMSKKQPLSLLILDIDHFKYINDHYGHDVGDDVLRQFTQQISALIRDTDVFARIGGEEFAVILANQPIELAQQMAERIRAQIESAEMPLDEQSTIKYTVSIGVSSIAEGVDIHRWLKNTDKLLYRAKEQGRNQVAAAVATSIHAKLDSAK